jgi:putative acetyltransferase
MDVRSERLDDIERVREINLEAFETETEANLVNALRNSGIHYISLVFVKNNEVMGHIFFSPVELAGMK